MIILAKGMVRHGQVRYGEVWYGLVGYSLVCYGRRLVRDGRLLNMKAPQSARLIVL